MIGFAIDYRRSDSAFAAVQWARWLESRGHSVKIFPFTVAGSVCASWDARANRNKDRGYIEWLKPCAHVVFFSLPPIELVSLASTSGAKTILVCCWDELTEGDVDLLAAFDTVVCPSRAGYKHLKYRKWRYKRAVKLTWDLMLPLVSNDQEVDPDRIGVIWNLDGSQAERQDADMLGVLAALIDLQFLYFTVLYNDSLSNSSKSKLDDLKFKADGRLEVLRKVSIEQQVVTSSVHDLTIWPSLHESFGIPGLISVAAGTPCIAYDHPVIAEIVKPGVSGELVPCELSLNSFEVPSCVPDSKRFFTSIVELVNDPERLQSMRATSQLGYDNRRDQFEFVSSGLFNS